MAQRIGETLEHPAHGHGFRPEGTPPLARELEDGGDEAFHLGDRHVDEAYGLVEIPLDLLAAGIALGLASGGEKLGLQGFQLVGESHDIDERRTQVVTDDVGVALQLIVRFLQFGGALRERIVQPPLQALGRVAARVVAQREDGAQPLAIRAQNGAGAAHRQELDPVPPADAPARVGNGFTPHHGAASGRSSSGWGRPSSVSRLQLPA